MTSNTKSPGSLIDAVRSQNSEPRKGKSEQLEPYLAELGELVSEGIPLANIMKGLSELGVEVSKSYLGTYLKQNFPKDYQSNYTDRLVGGRTKGNPVKKIQSDSTPKLIPSESEKKEVNTTKSAASSKDTAQHSSGKQSESTDMISSFVEENRKNKD
jgi:hypothetical protein